MYIIFCYHFAKLLTTSLCLPIVALSLFLLLLDTTIDDSITFCYHFSKLLITSPCLPTVALSLFLLLLDNKSNGSMRPTIRCDACLRARDTNPCFGPIEENPTYHRLRQTLLCLFHFKPCRNSSLTDNFGAI